MRSCAEHAQIVAALEAGDMALAEQRLADHLGSWQSKLHVPANASDPLDQLRQALEPVHPAAPRTPSSPRSPSTLTGTLQ
jgi:DNA-binding GntR family transcriptional regulator